MDIFLLKINDDDSAAKLEKCSIGHRVTNITCPDFSLGFNPHDYSTTIDINEKMIWEIKNPNRNSMHQINLHEVSTGVYTLIVETNSGNAYEKLLVL